MHGSTRDDTLSDESFQMELEELNGAGKKNAKHSEEVHDEIELTRSTMAAFLGRELPKIAGDDWMKECVEAAFKSYASANPFAIMPSHGSICNYDLRSLTVIMEYNLSLLHFERDEKVQAREIREVVRIRNLYEHRDRQLNSRNWRSDVQTLQVFRSKMKTDREIESEQFELKQLAQMEADTSRYLDNLDQLQRQVDAISHSVLDIGQSLHEHAKNDIQQFDELDRQRIRDKQHDEAIDENERDIEWLTTRDRIQHYAIIGALVLGLVNIGLLVIEKQRR